MAVLSPHVRAIESAHDYLGLSYQKIAEAIKADESTLHRWRSGGEPPPVFAARLEALEEFLDVLKETVSSGAGRSRVARDRGSGAQGAPPHRPHRRRQARSFNGLALRVELGDDHLTDGVPFRGLGYRHTRAAHADPSSTGEGQNLVLFL
jgi:hypothetical protein